MAWISSVNAAKQYLIDTLYNRSIPIKAKVTQITGLPEGTTVGGTGNGNGDEPSPGEKTKAANGIDSSPRSELALTGEEGPELVETKTGAYLVGMEGPQMAYINRGDRVYTAEETKEIYKRRGL
jgi:hypothetical protein